MTFDEKRISKLLDRIEPHLRKRFLKMVDNLRAHLGPDSVETLIREGRTHDAAAVFDRAAELYAHEITNAFDLSASTAATWLQTALDVVVNFEQFNARAVAYVREHELRLVREFTREQQSVTSRAIEDGIARGANPRDQARDFRDAIGLTEKQQQAVAKYRELLEQNSSKALDRALRDKRFDPTVERAISSGNPLGKAEIDRMVERYSERYVKYRSEVIARTEALRAVHAGVEEMFDQTYDSGLINPDDVERQWNTAGDERVRPAHAAMDGQKVGVGENFTDGDGNQIAYPGDPSAPPATSIQCRCVVATRIVRFSVPTPEGAEAVKVTVTVED